LFLFEPRSFVPLATVQDNKTYWYQCDQVGAPQELTDREGNIVWAADYKVWGEVSLRKTGTDGSSRYARRRQAEPPPVLEQPFRFQGQQFDEETGLHYNRFRYYDPGVGRFVSQDPIGLLGGSNLFAYAPNPLGWIDPLGLANKENKPGCSCTGGDGEDVTKKVLKRDMTKGPHAPDTKIQKVIDRANHGNKSGTQGRWNSQDAAQRAANQNTGTTHSVPIENGDGVLVTPLPDKGGVWLRDADRAITIPKKNGEIHTFPIGPEHPNY
jgi:RHS repeat-associated protein